MVGSAVCKDRDLSETGTNCGGPVRIMAMEEGYRTYFDGVAHSLCGQKVPHNGGMNAHRSAAIYTALLMPQVALGWMCICC